MNKPTVHLYRKEKVRQFIVPFLYSTLDELSTLCTAVNYFGHGYLGIMMKISSVPVHWHRFYGIARVWDFLRSLLCSIAFFITRFLLWSQPWTGAVTGMQKNKNRQLPLPYMVVTSKSKLLFKVKATENALVCNYLCATLCFRFSTSFKQKSLIQTFHL